MKRTLLFLTAFLLAGFALAQAFDVPPFDPSMFMLLWENPLFMASAIVGIVAAVRKSQAWLDGPLLVPAFGAIVGALLGAVGQLASLLTVQPFAEMSFPWGGALYGALAALSGTVGLNLIEYVAGLFKRGTPDTTTLALVAAGHSPSAGAWIVEQARGLVPQNKLTAALDLLSPLIAKFAGSALTDELRSDLQAQIHKTLKAAKLIPERDFGRKS